MFRRNEAVSCSNVVRCRVSSVELNGSVGILSFVNDRGSLWLGDNLLLQIALHTYC